MGTQKPGEWANSLIARFEEQLPYKTGAQSLHTRLTEEQCKACLVQISRHRFSLVIAGLTKILQRINEQYQPTLSSSSVSRSSELDKGYHDSLVIVLDTLEICLSSQPKDTTKYDEAMNVKILLREVCQFIDMRNESTVNNVELRQLSSKVLFALSLNFFNAVFNRISARLQEVASSSEENPDYTDIELIQHINVDILRLIRLLTESIQKFKLLRKSAHIVLVASLEKAIWNWMDTYPQEFAEVQCRPNDELSKCCDTLFDILQDSFSDNKKSRVAMWPLQVMLLVLNPKVLEEIVNADSGAPCSPRHTKKKLFIDSVKRGLSPQNNSKQMTEAAVVTCVKLCKASTYLNIADSGNVTFVLVKSVINDLKSLLFNPSKSYIRGNLISGYSELDLMTDCFVSLFRIMPHNNDALKVCLNLNTHLSYHYVIVNSLLRIIKQPRLPWWPQIELLYPRAAELRAMFTDTLNKATQGYIVHTPLRMISLSLKSKEVQSKFNRSEEMPAYRNLLLSMVRLIHADPMLMLSNPGRSGIEIQSSTTELINGLVSLVHQAGMGEISQEAMDALLALHRPDRVHMWHPDAPENTFWDISSQVLYNISQKLIQRQIGNYREVLRWLRDILTCRNDFLAKHKDYANQGSQLPICKQAHIKLEVVFFMCLWSIDTDVVLVGMSCFALLCQEADIRCGSDEITTQCLLPNYAVFQEIAHTSTVLTTGSAALQKRIMALLRKIEHCVNGVQPVWEETFRNWDSLCKILQKYPKGQGDKMDECQMEALHRAVAKRRVSHHTSSEHDFEMQIQEWANITSFLCALGGVCLQRRPSTVWSYLHSHDSRKYNVLANSSQEVQYCPVTHFHIYRFIGQLLRLLLCSNERFGHQIQTHVKELVGHEMSPALYPTLFDQIKAIIDKFFDQQQQVMLTDINTQFVEHTIFIMKSILDNKKSGQPSEPLSTTSIEGLMLAIVRYVRHLDMTVLSVHIKTKLCQVVEAMMKRRDDLAFRQEMKFRNKMVEYVTDWVLGTSHQIAPPLRPDSSTISRYLVCCRELDQACMEAVAALLKGLPLQPEESDRGDLMEAKSQLFLKYFTLFMNLLNDCNEVELAEGPGRLEPLRTATIQAMSNLLSANIDSGLMHSIDLGYHRDLQTRAAFMEVLTKILHQGTEFDTLAETVLADRFEQLVQLVTMISDKGELPIAMALANVVSTSQMDELARVFVTLFDAKHLLAPLLWNIFYREVENATLYEVSAGRQQWHDPILYCVDMLTDNTTEKPRAIAAVCYPEIQEGDSPVLYIAYAIGLLLSVPFLLATFLVYAFIPDLRNLHGMCLMSYCAGLMVAYIFLAYLKVQTGQIGVAMTGCYVIAFIVYYSFQSSFFWLNVMCFDIWRTFSGYRGGSSHKRRENRRFALYGAYAWGIPLALAGCTIGMQFAELPSGIIKPGFGTRRCWFENWLSEMVYFFTPVLILVVCNVVLFSITSYRIRSIRQETAILKGSESARSDKLKKDKQRYGLYVKLFVVMGVNWTVELISFAVGGSNWYWILVDISNIALGFFIFFIFVWKKKVRNLAAKRFRTMFGMATTAPDMRKSPWTSSTHTEDTRVSASADDPSMRLKDLR
ncbi:neurofibromin-like [Ostrinia furnacalis]|uniref:neurofibromin-like n=1 Tax=Ostrinia furnacalis TaxID=93504 RepID=UPI00103D69C0|nr:neurofibromin-like [Ostrinia furnacalis]